MSRSTKIATECCTNYKNDDEVYPPLTLTEIILDYKLLTKIATTTRKNYFTNLFDACL